MKKLDPYALAQYKAKRDAHQTRKKELIEERKIAAGDPVRGITTPFIESLDTVAGSTLVTQTVTEEGTPGPVEVKISEDMLLNHLLTPKELEASLKNSFALTEPSMPKNRSVWDPVKEDSARKEFEAGHANATAALTRILSLANASSKDKTRANITRCIDTFGRHNTDQTLRPRAQPSPETLSPDMPEKTPRAGPDTGSSEVQIAILTAKIRVLADQLETRGGKKDKINKRNLRVMVHKRQKHLQYLRRKERGSDRYQHVVDTLGLTEGTWKGEISL